MDNIKKQFYVLLLGTIFAWGNFIYEFINWQKEQACTTGCSAGAANPFLTPCFFGALFFLAAFLLNLKIGKEKN
ncbi:MAG TPA: hypothetical protein PLA41_02340 [Candidatus Pacearchaeota archaeon]|nr:hypothetical protein [Candidatus Parcubacteria bacterium]HNZ83770.1 hypothetical protein [Candidatus Pacearchaeota archaeon]HOU45965.1 hypothetical protein [Candidatus Pacearchaeota archaeon]HPM08749.1 hypothetical protein [Candidatus Pacearchaeota archaeon]HQI74636.1 hypothetical protein [Candidatus Pacearchaeota archaeon]